MIYLFLADGFEEIETFGTIDILRRCNLQVQTLSITGRRIVTSARGIVVKADSLFRKNHMPYCDALILPGGLKGAETMAKNTLLRAAIVQQAAQGVIIAAICAAPMVLGTTEVLKRKHATIYSGMESYIPNAIYHSDAFVVEHDNIITACGPAATHLFAVTIARKLVNNLSIVDEVERGMCYTGHTPTAEQVLRF